jgi:spectinomycin phosphotransferase
VRDLPGELETDAVVEALADGWGFDADAIEYAAVGAGSYHWLASDAAGTRRFVTVDDLDQKRWLGETRDAARVALGRAFGTAAALRQAGLEFVVAPIPANGGESLRRIGERHAVALFPFVEGEGGRWGPYEPGARAAVVSMLAELHRATPAGSVRTVGLELTGRRVLEAALSDVSETWSGGPLSEPARQAFAGHASEVPDFLALADRLAAGVERRGATTVVTHGEPHAGNVLRTDRGHVLVDWDTVALGPRERDLWWLADEPGDLAAYTTLTGHEVDLEAVAFFRLAWDLNDVAAYLSVLRQPHAENEDTLDAYAGVTRWMPSRERWLAGA